MRAEQDAPPDRGHRPVRERWSDGPAAACERPVVRDTHGIGLMSLLDEALLARKCLIGVMCAHAGEDAAGIFSRKTGDCREVGRTLWVAKSAKARPAQVQAICSTSNGYVIFVEPAAPGGARPTKESDSATEYSSDRATPRSGRRSRNRAFMAAITSRRA